MTRTVSEQRSVTRIKQLTQAFELAESGLDTVLRALKLDFDSPRDNNGNPIAIGAASGLFNSPGTLVASQIVGQFRYRIDNTANPNIRRVRAMGYVPNAANPAATRCVEAYVERVSPPGGFFDNTIWTNGDVTINGSSYSVKGEDYVSSIDGIDNDGDASIDEAGERDLIDNDNDTVVDEAGEGGNIMYGGQITGDTSYVEGDETQLPSGTNFYYLNFDAFKSIAISQNNYYTTAQLGDKEYMKTHPFPTGFWNDVGETTPNVVYLEGDLDVSGNIQLGGVFVVAKDVIASAGSAEIGGTIDFNGIIYSLGNVRIHGTVDLLGGVWAGAGGAELDGNVTLGFNYAYVNAFEALIAGNLSANLKSWHEPSFQVDRDNLT